MKHLLLALLLLAPCTLHTVNRKPAVVFAYHGDWSDNIHDVMINKQIKKIIKNNRDQELSL